MPEAQFDILEERMLRHDKTLFRQEVDGQTMLVSRKSCEELGEILGCLQFVLSGTEIVIKPEGYLYNMPNMNDCFVGVSSIPDVFNQYRLGTIFLRNFYMGLDYKND